MNELKSTQSNLCKNHENVGLEPASDGATMAKGSSEQNEDDPWEF